MGVAIGVIATVGIIAFLVWVALLPSEETTLGRENRARREAKKAGKAGSTDGRADV